MVDEPHNTTTSMKERFKMLCALGNEAEMIAIVKLLPEDKKAEYKAIWLEAKNKRESK